ncbi:kinase-like domain-containing protein [Mycena vulgaris]|nr:kinase-like domain-containing protein [Mycena vulgaris]
MAELAVGLVGAAVTVGAASLAIGAGFTGRHENSHREEMMDTRRTMAEFIAYLKSQDVSQDREREFLKTRQESLTESLYSESSAPGPFSSDAETDNQEIRNVDSEDEISDSGSEDREDHEPGGYHPVRIGESLSGHRYIVVRKLCWDHFYTVWLAWDTKMSRQVALKVSESAGYNITTALEGIKFLQRLVTIGASIPNHPGKYHVMTFLDHFRHTGPNHSHICTVFEVLGEDLLGLIKQHKKQGVPIPIVKQIAKQVLLGLDYMHRFCNIIHTDIKPENVFIDVQYLFQADPALASPLPPPTSRTRTHSSYASQPLSSSSGGSSYVTYQSGIGFGRPMARGDIPSTINLSSQFSHLHSGDSHAHAMADRTKVKIGGLGNATLSDHHSTDDIQTRQYRSPEVIVGAKWGKSADVWSLACVIFELVTGGDYLFDPVEGHNGYSADHDHLAQMIELTGECPRSISRGGKYSSEFFKRKGALRHIRDLQLWPLDLVLREKYYFTKPDADALASFLKPMLRMDPEKRAQAIELLSHDWLEGIIVQGELEVIERAERGNRAR